jgi:hypothetical protein
MKKVFLIILIIFLVGCDGNEKNQVSVSFPLYGQCDNTLKKVASFLGRSDTGYSFEMTKKEFGVRPPYGDIPYGIGSLHVSGDMKLMVGTTEEYLELHLNGMFADCMPSNSILMGDGELASKLDEKFGRKVITGYVENNKFWVLVNDGSYSYPH